MGIGFTTPQGQATFLHGFPQQQELWGTRWSWKLLWLVVSCLWSSYSSPERGSRENRRENQADGEKMKDAFSVGKLSSEPCNHCLFAWLLLPSMLLTCDIAIFIHKLDMGQNLRDGTMGCVDVIKPPVFFGDPYDPNHAVSSSGVKWAAHGPVWARVRVKIHGAQYLPSGKLT